jgi:hypothetical protein
MTTAPSILPGCSVLPPPTPAERRGALAQSASHAPQPTRRNGPTADRFRVLNAFVDESMGALNRSEIAVWMVLYRDTRDEIAQTSQAAIAVRTGADVRTVRRAVQRLLKSGLLILVYRGGLNRGASRYRVVGASIAGKILRTPEP